MAADKDSLKQKLAPLSDDIHLLGDLLGNVICEQHGIEAFELEEKVRKAAIARRQGESSAQQVVVDAIEQADLEQKRILTKSFSTYFQLVNIAEDQQRVRVLREREREGQVAESLAAAIDTLTGEGWSGDEVLQLLDRINIDLVLTAHPTEAKRQDFLIKLHDISNLVDERDRLDLAPREQDRIRRGILAGIEEMWQTSITRSQKPSVIDEVEFGLYFVGGVVMEAVVGIHRELLRQLRPLSNRELRELPVFLQFSSWIGGDRDGHPHVTPDVTRETVRRMRNTARYVYRQKARALRDRLTQTLDEIEPSDELLNWLPADPDLAAQYPEQPYRQAMAVIAGRLESDEYQRDESLLADLRMIEASLLLHAGTHTANDELWELIQMVRIFGLHLMPLDLREDARRMLRAVDELLGVLEVHPNYLELEEAERRQLLVQLLAEGNSPDTSELDLSEDTEDVLAGLFVAAELMDQYGDHVFRSFIGSMSQQASDVLALQWLARITSLEGRVDIVPLFETLDDLSRAPAAMEFLLSTEPYRGQLAVRNDCQQIMIGYSDSAKDGGYLASNWSLYQAQEELAEVTLDHGICLQLFHGRGGSIGRGGGPTNRAIQAQPKRAMHSGSIRLTEQGEVIAYRYGRREIADRHLQQVVHATLLAAGQPQMEPPEERWLDYMDQLAEYGREAFQDLVYHSEGFLDYWMQITPFRELEELPIGSRPATRREGGFDAVRAIPWVFSWMQCRAILPSWFGIGAAVERLTEESGEATEILQTMYQSWPLFKLLIENVELDLAKVELGIADHYSQLVDDGELRREYNQRIKDEYARTKESILAITGRDQLLEWMPVIQHSIERRNPYVDPLNFIQVSLLKELRGLPEGSERQQRVLDAVLSTVNGVAAGMKNTG